MSILQVANIWFESTANTRINCPDANTMTMVVGGANVVVANTTSFKVSGNNLTLGTGSSSATANGYTYLPNGILMQWGQVTFAGGTQTVTFPTAFPTSCYSVSAMPSNPASGLFASVTISNNSTMTLSKTDNSTSVTQYWTAVGV